jgi:two-component system nitrate/nitrite response regulator NarL
MTAQTLTLVHDRSLDTDTPSTNVTRNIATTLICDSPLLLSGLQNILQESPFVLTEAAFAAVLELPQQIASQPALVIVEAQQDVSRLVKVVRQVRERTLEARIIVLAGQFDLSLVLLGHEAGVDGFCLTATPPKVLIKSFELVMLGESVLPFDVLRSIMGAAPDRDQPLQDNAAEPSPSGLKTCKLSAREMEILGCLREGAPNKVIARKLDIAEATIKVHVKAILRKIGIANRTQAAIWATKHLPTRGGAVRRV